MMNIKVMFFLFEVPVLVGNAYWGMTAAVAPPLPTENITPPMPIVPVQPPPPTPQLPITIEPSKVLADKVKKPKKDKVGIR